MRKQRKYKVGDVVLIMDRYWYDDPYFGIIATDPFGGNCEDLILVQIGDGIYSDVEVDQLVLISKGDFK
jgi:hypothetical protein